MMLHPFYEANSLGDTRVPNGVSAIPSIRNAEALARVGDLVEDRHGHDERFGGADLGDVRGDVLRGRSRPRIGGPPRAEPDENPDEAPAQAQKL